MAVKTLDNKSTGGVALADAVGVVPRGDIVARVVKAVARRAGTHKAKPFRGFGNYSQDVQAKGTGRASWGSICCSIPWRWGCAWRMCGP